MLGDAPQHSRPNFLSIVEYENKVWKSVPIQHFVRPGCAFDGPAKLDKRPQYFPSLRAWPLAHAAKEIVIGAEK